MEPGCPARRGADPLLVEAAAVAPRESARALDPPARREEARACVEESTLEAAQLAGAYLRARAQRAVARKVLEAGESRLPPAAGESVWAPRRAEEASFVRVVQAPLFRARQAGLARLPRSPHRRPEPRPLWRAGFWVQFPVRPARLSFSPSQPDAAPPALPQDPSGAVSLRPSPPPASWSGSFSL